MLMERLEKVSDVFFLYSIVAAAGVVLYCVLLYSHHWWRPLADIRRGNPALIEGISFVFYPFLIYMFDHIHIYSKTSLNRPSIGLTLCGQFMELKYCYG